MLTTKNAGGLVSPAAIDEESMVSIKILKDTICGGEKVKAGQIVEASVKDAHLLLATKKAEPGPDKVTKPTTRKPRTSTRKKK